MPTEHSSSSANADDDTRQPWRCDSCRKLIHNVDSKGYPAPGAPSSYFGGTYGGKRYEQVCTMCYQMKDAITNSDYWRGIQNTEDTIRNQRIEKFKASGGGIA